MHYAGMSSTYRETINVTLDSVHVHLCTYIFMYKVKMFKTEKKLTRQNPNKVIVT